MSYETDTLGDHGPCDHPDFVARVDVNRLSDTEDGPIVGYSADVTIRCTACDEPFVFIGVPFGVSPTHPTVAIGGKELRCPVRPASAPDGWGEDGPSVSMHVTGQAHCHKHVYNVSYCTRCQAAERNRARAEGN
jgi:hypothetical protein